MVLEIGRTMKRTSSTDCSARTVLSFTKRKKKVANVKKNPIFFLFLKSPRDP